MHPLFHAETSVKLWGGQVDDYLPVHNWLDATKETFCDFRHRALRHHSQGIFEAERVFGLAIVNSNGKHVPTRYVCEQHIKEDCGGRVPTVADWLRNLQPEVWMSRRCVVETTSSASARVPTGDPGAGETP
jgi:hypothetical protein